MCTDLTPLLRGDKAAARAELEHIPVPQQRDVL
jgi:hypothetical protein